jgi:hypothetical protein
MKGRKMENCKVRRRVAAIEKEKKVSQSACMWRIKRHKATPTQGVM